MHVYLFEIRNQTRTTTKLLMNKYTLLLHLEPPYLTKLSGYVVSPSFFSLCINVSCILLFRRKIDKHHQTKGFVTYFYHCTLLIIIVDDICPNLIKLSNKYYYFGTRGRVEEQFEREIC